MPNNEPLEEAVRRVLIDGLPAGLKRAIDRLLARGASKPGVLSAVRAMVAKVRQHPEQGKLTVAGVEAYLETK